MAEYMRRYRLKAEVRAEEKRIQNRGELRREDRVIEVPVRPEKPVARWTRYGCWSEWGGYLTVTRVM